MFESLSDKLNLAFRKITGKAELSEKNISDAMEEIRLALMDADVNYSVVKEFIAQAREACLGEKVLKSVQPGQQAIKVVSDLLVELMGNTEVPLNIDGKPAVIMMVGLHGAGKTTTTGKLALKLRTEGKKVLLVACDVQRPAAIHQLEVLGKSVGVEVYSDHNEKDVVKIATMAMSRAKIGEFDVVLLDTAGRLQIDEKLVQELVKVKTNVQPQEIILVADAALGQEAVSVAEHFHKALTITGLILTKLDGDARGGAALSIRKVTSVPIKFVGSGEKLEDLDVFYPERMASRILGMGDVVSLVEKAAEQISEDDAKKLEEKLRTKKFDLQDFYNQLKMLKKLGGLGFILKMLPGGNQLKDALAMGEGQLKKIEAMILSMTKFEKENPSKIEISRKKRIAKGSGTNANDVGELITRFNQMKNMMSGLAKMPGFGSNADADESMSMPNPASMMSPMGGLGGLPGLGGGLGGLPGLGGGNRGNRGVVGVSRDSGISEKELKRLKRERQKKKKK